MAKLSTVAQRQMPHLLATPETELHVFEQVALSAEQTTTRTSANVRGKHIHTHCTTNKTNIICFSHDADRWC